MKRKGDLNELSTFAKEALSDETNNYHQHLCLLKKMKAKHEDATAQLFNAYRAANGLDGLSNDLITKRLQRSKEETVSENNFSNLMTCDLALTCVLLVD
jgi:hypothetical protein